MEIEEKREGLGRWLIVLAALEENLCCPNIPEWGRGFL